MQDWEPCVVQRVRTKKELIKAGECETHKKFDGGTNSQKKVDVKKLDSDDIVVPVKSNHDLGLQIQQARLAKKMNQKELDQKCNFPKNTINEYESGKAIYNQTQIDTISKVLGIRLKKPKTQ